MAAHPQARPARVVEQHRSGYIVADGPGEGFAVESLPEWQRPSGYRKGSSSQDQRAAVGDWVLLDGKRIVALLPRRTAIKRRSEEHTSELQSLMRISYAVFCLKKKKHKKRNPTH